MAYAEATELARILNIRTPTADQTTALERVLDVAASEIDAEIDLDPDTGSIGVYGALVEQVNLQRAAEWWALQPVPLNVIGGDMGSTHLSKNSWEKYAHMLAPLKDQWGLA